MTTIYRSAISNGKLYSSSGLSRDIGGFLRTFSRQQDPELVGIVDPDPALRDKAEKNFHLDDSLFYSNLDDAIAKKHPRGLFDPREDPHRRTSGQEESIAIPTVALEDSSLHYLRRPAASNSILRVISPVSVQRDRCTDP